jgi:hypothetical protein
MDGFVCVRYQGVQRNLFMSRRLDDDRTNLTVGPLSIEVLEPLKRLKIELGDNDYEIGCSLEFQGRGVPWSRPFIEYPGGFGKQAGYDQAARYTGSITFEGKKFNADGFFGGRDRTWGFRGSSLANKSAPKPREPMYNDIVELWGFAHFSDFVLHIGFTWETPDLIIGRKGVICNNDGTVIPIVDQRHRIEFMPGFRQWAKAELLLKDAGGKERHLTITPISPACYLRGGGYTRHGEDRGMYYMEGGKWDVSQPFAVRDESIGYFSMNHRIAEFQLDGEETGVGYLESMFGQAENWEYKPTF